MALDESLPHQDITYNIIGAAMKVHTTLRSGLREVLYQNALEIEFTNLGIRFTREYPVEVYYEGQPSGLYFLDFLVEETVVVELKAIVRGMDNRELAQCLRYMQLTGAPLGLLINFGVRHLDWQRILPPKSWGRYDPNDDLWLRDKGYR